MQEMVTVSFRCHRRYAAALERAGKAEVLRELVAAWAEKAIADAMVAAYEEQPIDAEGRVPSAVPDRW